MMHPNVNEARFFKSFVPVVNALWMREVRLRPRPEFETTEGTPLATVRAVFDVTDHDRVRAAFDAAVELEAEGDAATLEVFDEAGRQEVFGARKRVRKQR